MNVKFNSIPVSFEKSHFKKSWRKQQSHTRCNEYIANYFNVSVHERKKDIPLQYMQSEMQFQHLWKFTFQKFMKEAKNHKLFHELIHERKKNIWMQSSIQFQRVLKNHISKKHEGNSKLILDVINTFQIVWCLSPL